VLAAALYRAVGTRVEPQQVDLTPANAESLLSGSAVVVDAFDNLPARRAVAGATTALGVPCLHIALAGAGDYGCGLWDDAYGVGGEGWELGVRGGHTNPRSLAPSPREACDYPLTRPLALLVAAAAAAVLVGHLLGGGRRGFEITLRDLRLALA
jgi:hypothetical protein